MHYPLLCLCNLLIHLCADLTSTLLSLSTTRLPLRTLVNARHQLSIYLSRFRNRLSTTHALHLKRLMNLVDALVQYAEEWRDAQLKVDKGNGAAGKARASEVEVMTSAELLQRLGRKAEGVNLLEVEKYLRESKVRVRVSWSLLLAHSRLICNWSDCTKDLRVLCQDAREGGRSR